MLDLPGVCPKDISRIVSAVHSSHVVPEALRELPRSLVGVYTDE